MLVKMLKSIHNGAELIKSHIGSNKFCLDPSPLPPLQNQSLNCGGKDNKYCCYKDIDCSKIAEAEGKEWGMGVGEGEAEAGL